MRKSLLYVTLAATSVGLVGNAFAAAPKLAKAKPLVVTDLAGDANGLRQDPLVPETSTPANAADADILSFGLGRKDNGKKVTALIGTLTLAAPPAMTRDYRIKMSSPTCSTYFLEFEYLANASIFTPQGEVRDNCSLATGSTSNFTPVDATVSGNTITWTIPINELPGDVTLGTVMTVNGAQSSVETAVIGPTLDDVVVQKSFKIGQ